MINVIIIKTIFLCVEFFRNVDQNYQIKYKNKTISLTLKD